MEGGSTPLTERTDEELVSLARTGDRDAEEALCERYKNSVRIKARPYFLIGADREDLTQEGMIGLYKAIRDYQPEHGASFRSFAELCILRQIINAIKAATRQKHAPLNSYVSLYQPVREEERMLIDVFGSRRAEDPEESYLSKVALADIFSSMDAMLTPLEKKVLDAFLDGHSYQRISGKLGCGVKTVDNALQRVKKKLEKHLREES